MSLRRDIGRDFERVDEPPVKQPPDYTDYPSGDVKTTAALKVPLIISQEGLHKRDVDKLKTALLIRSKNKIDVGKAFERVDDLSVKKSPDYTDYPSGDEMINRKKGIIMQMGLMKRNADIRAGAYDMETERRLGGLREEMRRKPNEIKPVKFRPSSGIKPVKNFGFLAAVDKFFIWLNKILGE